MSDHNRAFLFFVFIFPYHILSFHRHVVNSAELSSILRETTLPEGHQLVSFDVSALFTSVPLDVVIPQARALLEGDATLPERTGLTPDDIVKLLEFVLRTTFFQFRGNFYQQLFGAPMGSPVAPVVANILMEHLEQKVLDEPTASPYIWHRYVDDILAAVKPSEVDILLDRLNSVYPSIKFTVEREEEGQLPFLDMTLKRSLEGKITTEVYYKSTASGQYLNFLSHHPDEHKRTVVQTLAQRAFNISGDADSKHKELNNIRANLKANDYPAKYVDSEIRKTERYHQQAAGAALQASTQDPQAPPQTPKKHFC